MKILLVSVGTRGDMEPMLAVGEIMRDKGHQVICAFPEQFAFLAEESNMAFASQIPYEWIFPQVYGVIHHGGSGTTHMALTHGRASMIVPHIIDQFVWDSIIAGLGAGPRGIKVGKIRTESLEPKILDLVNNPAFMDKAGQVASQMAREDFTEELYQAIIAA